MTTFEYKTRDRQGKIATGVAEANTPEEVASNLRKVGHAVISVNTKRDTVSAASLLPKAVRIRKAELSIFTRQLATLVEVGIPLTSGLESIQEQTENPFLKEIIGEVIVDVQGGLSLSDALAKHPTSFNQTYISMVRAAEASGTLQISLNNLAALIEYEEETKNKIKAATRYPVTVTTALIVGFLILTMAVLPRYAKIYSRFNVQLPLPTRILLGINYLFTHYWYAVLIFAILAFFGFNYYINTKKGREAWDSLKLKIPVFGPLLAKISLSRFARVSGLMLTTGVPILKVLDNVSAVAGNVKVTKSVTRLRESANMGSSIASAMKQDKIFPPIVTQMVSLGEESGKLDSLLLKVSDFFDTQIDMTIRSMTSLLEPILILFLGFGVLTMALSVFLPMWNLISVFKK
jgi:type II secretory pathway component PulF